MFVETLILTEQKIIINIFFSKKKILNLKRKEKFEDLKGKHFCVALELKTQINTQQHFNTPSKS